MDRIAIIDQIRRNDKLLSLPQVLSKVLEEIGKEDFSPHALAKVILMDPNLTSRVLKMVNSPFYHRMSRITTVNQAISIMGVTTVKCMALSTSIFHPDRIAAESGIDSRSLFQYELAIAAASEQTAKAIGYKAPEEAFIAGLLQDIGLLFLLHHYPREYRRVIQREHKHCTLEEAEREIFGLDHAEAGGYLAETWRLPEYVVAAIKRHHDNDRPGPDDTLPNIVRLAVLLTSDHFSGYETKIERRLEEINRISGLLSIKKETIDEISSSLLASTITTADFLGIDIGNVEEMLVRANQEIWKSYLTIENLFKERQELTRKLLDEEHAKGAEESKNVAMATLSHYLNNAVMAIYGRSQLLRMQGAKGSHNALLEKLSGNLDVIDKSVKKIVAVLEEMKEISPIDKNEFYNMSEAMNIDDRIARRLVAMERAADLTQAMTPPGGRVKIPS